MSILHNVYDAFSTLEASYKRSRKSRREFITDKFGGDIDIGSTIILNAVSAEDYTDPEDVRKLTFIRNIIGQIVAMQDSLDAVTNFGAFTDGANYASFLRILEQSMREGTKQIPMEPATFIKANPGVFHFSATPEGMQYVPFGQCPVMNLYNEHMLERVRQNFEMVGHPEERSLVGIKNAMRAEPIALSTAVKRMKGG